MRILIAEDDPVSRLILRNMLKKWGHDPVVTADGRAALEVLRQDSAPEIAILDWMMPEMDGLQVCRAIREDASACPAYIILLTAKTQRQDVVAGLGAGADDYVTKPFDQDELCARLQVGIRMAELQRKLADRARSLEVALTRVRRVQQTQKLESLGQMASGVAHEINTPMQYVGDNIRFLQESWLQLLPRVDRHGTDPEAQYLLKEIPKAIDDALEGVRRVATIVKAMRDFSQSSGEQKVPVDINRIVETTITVTRSEWKYVADVETVLAPDLPMARCLPGEMHQVLLNLLVNAAQAIGELGSDGKGLIRITTCQTDNCIEIRITDTGTGIPERHQARVFDPFFTTKEVGKGAGQGLATAYAVIVQEHKGRIRFETEEGKGTTFFIQIPIDGMEATDHE